VRANELEALREKLASFRSRLSAMEDSGLANMSVAELGAMGACYSGSHSYDPDIIMDADTLRAEIDSLETLIRRLERQGHEDRLKMIIAEKIKDQVQHAKQVYTGPYPFAVDFGPIITASDLEQARVLIETKGNFSVTYIPPVIGMIPHGMNTGPPADPMGGWIGISEQDARIEIHHVTEEEDA